MKNIVLIIDNLVVGGAQTTNLGLAEAFLEKGYNVTLIVLKSLIDLDVNPAINLIELKYEKKYFSLLNRYIYANKLKNILDSIKEENGEINLILASLGLSHNLASMINTHKIHYVMHSSVKISQIDTKKNVSKFFKTRQLRKIYNNKNIICVSKGLEDDLLSLKIKPLSIQTIYNFFNFEHILNLSNAKLDYDFPNDYIVHVGRFSKDKRHDILIKAFHKIENKDIKLVLVGDGAEKQNINLLIEKLNLQDRVILMGFQQNPYPIIKKAKMLVLSSEHEGFGNVIVESLILNTIVVSTDCPYGPYEILNDNLSQCLVEMNDDISLSKVINNILENPPEIKNSYINKFNRNEVIKEYKLLMN